MFWTMMTTLGSYLYIIIMIIPVVFLSILSINGNSPHIVARYWARLSLLCANSKVEIRGQENIPDGPAVYMPNHVSHFDVFAILGYLNVQFRWTVKKELFDIPLLGLAMRKVGYILVDRGNHEKAIQSMKLAAEKIRAGTSIVIFPEGTRSADGVLQYPFKKGGFHMALEASVPVIPVTILGSREILPKNGIKVKPGKIILTIGKGIQPDGHNVNSLMEEVYKSIKLGYTS
jgi:1-acyl-sn-glycerol-3-phosphate acyltransferase